MTPPTEGGGTGICPNCKVPISLHGPNERKHCHDALSGYRRHHPTEVKP